MQIGFKFDAKKFQTKENNFWTLHSDIFPTINLEEDQTSVTRVL